MKMMQWLDEEAKGLAVIGFIVLAGLLDASIAYSIGAALENWGVIPMPTGDFTNPFVGLSIYTFSDMVLVAPLLEELFFRLLPLALVIGLVSKSPKFVFGAVICFAVLFGAVHPASYGLYGKIDVAIAGFLFGLVFLKCGGLNKRFIKATAASIAAHGVSNLFVLLYGYWMYLQAK